MVKGTICGIWGPLMATEIVNGLGAILGGKTIPSYIQFTNLLYISLHHVYKFSI